jgi:polyisoprenoid-binding protein YceI
MAATKWNFDFTHSNVDFSVRHLLVSKVRGRFNKWSGTLLIDEDDLGASSVEVQIDAASVDTSEPKRDEHLRSAEFFDVEKFPHLTFKSTGVEKNGDDRLRVAGDLTLHGITRPVVLDVERGGSVRDPWGLQRTGFTVTTSIDRKDFGITFNQALDHGGLALGEKVSISIDIEATSAAVVAQAA